jgi:hypothetical protein
MEGEKHAHECMTQLGGAVQGRGEHTPAHAEYSQVYVATHVIALKLFLEAEVSTPLVVPI